MQRNISQIIWLLLLFGFISISYFFSLLLYIPLLASLVLIITYAVFSYRWMSKRIFNDTVPTPSAKYTMWSYIILLAGLIIMINKSYYLEIKYGGYDAMLIWNYHAKFLQHPEYWKQLFTINRWFHADYPLFLPGVIGFSWRLLGTDTILIPFAISFCITILIPVVIYLSLYQKNLPIAALVLILFATDDFYLTRGISQYADVPLALLYLCTIISADHLKSNKFISLIVGALLGCCIWVKNEGAMLAILFCMFYIKDIFAQKRWQHFLVGIAIPLLALIIFKTFAPSNDLLENRKIPLADYFTDGARYKLIASHLADNLNDNFAIIKFGLIAYAVLCIIERRFPGRNIWLLLSCVAGYFFVYVFSNQGLEWHLQTSMDRVLLQLMPSFVYVIAMRLSRLKLSLPEKQL